MFIKARNNGDKFPAPLLLTSSNIRWGCDEEVDPGVKKEVVEGKKAKAEKSVVIVEEVITLWAGSGQSIVMFYLNSSTSY